MVTSFEPAIEQGLAGQRDALQGVIDIAREALKGVERMSLLTFQLTRDSLSATGGKGRAILIAASDDTGGRSLSMPCADPDWGASYFAQACAIAAETMEALTSRMHQQVLSAHHALAKSLLAAAEAPPGTHEDVLEAARVMIQATPRTIADVIDVVGAHSTCPDAPVAELAPASSPKRRRRVDLATDATEKA